MEITGNLGYIVYFVCTLYAHATDALCTEIKYKPQV